MESYGTCTSVCLHGKDMPLIGLRRHLRVSNTVCVISSCYLALDPIKTYTHFREFVAVTGKFCSWSQFKTYDSFKIIGVSAYASYGTYFFLQFFLAHQIKRPLYT